MYESKFLNPYILGNRYTITDAMIYYLDGYLLKYNDMPDWEICLQFANEFDLEIKMAYEIEQEYFMTNRRYIYAYISEALSEGVSDLYICKNLKEKFGIEYVETAKYIRHTRKEGADITIKTFFV